MAAWRHLAAIIMSLTLTVPSFAADVIRIARENGAVHREFRNMLADVLGRFPTGVGRAQLTGRAGSETCVANLFTNTDTTFVTLNVGDREGYTEFYVDHPTQSFKSVLFQTLTETAGGKELKVVTREYEYSVKLEDERLSLQARQGKTDAPLACSFDLASARLFEGETE